MEPNSITCPVEMSDYTSTLIGADWYEEQGNQRAAEEIREKVDIPCNYPMWTLRASARYLPRISFCTCSRTGRVWAHGYNLTHMSYHLSASRSRTHRA